MCNILQIIYKLICFALGSLKNLVFILNYSKEALFFYIYAAMQMFDIETLISQAYNTLDYWFWTPVLSWIGLYFWFFRVSYPRYLRKLVNKGVKWAIMPKWRGYWLPLDILFTLLMALFSAVPAIWAIQKWLDFSWYYGFAVSPFFLVVGVFFCHSAKRKAARLYQSAYFYEYRRVRYESEVKGIFRSETDVQNHTVWSFTKKLKNAEAHGRLWKYINAMAKTKKIPPDVLAQTMI